MLLDLLKGIQQFQNQLHGEEKAKLASLREGQFPEAIVITCADSRVDQNLFTHSDPGRLFKTSNPGNIIPPYSANNPPSAEVSTIEYGLGALGIKNIIVCGHSECGAMKGLLKPDLAESLPSTAHWINHARPVLEGLEARHPDLNQRPEMQMEHITKDNVLLQMRNLQTYPIVQKYLAEGHLKIHGWYYEIDTGLVHVYHPASNSFISHEQALAEEAARVFHEIVQQQAKSYLQSLTSPKNDGEFTQLRQTIDKVRAGNIQAIWEHIGAKALPQLQSRLGSLYSKAAFDAQLAKEVNLPLERLATIEDAMKKSRFNKQSLAFMSGQSKFLHAGDKESDEQPGAGPKL